MGGQEWLTVTNACHALAISQRTLYRRIDSGLIQSKVENGKRFVLIDLPTDKPEADNFVNVADKALIEQVQKENELLRNQLIEKDKQIGKLQEEISEHSQRTDTIIMQLTRNLESQKMLESAEMKRKRAGGWFSKLWNIVNKK